MSFKSDKDTAVAAGSPVAEQSLRTVIRENVDGMLVIDREGVVVFANPAAERLLGRAAQALNGTLLGFPVVAGESSEIDVAAGPAPRTAEMRVVAIGWEGKPAALASLRDVTERRRANDELRRLSGELELRVRERTAELEAAVGELEAFSYSVSHDLRAPLRAMNGFSAILSADYAEQLDERGQHYLSRVRAGAQRMGTMIDQLLLLSRVSRAELHREQIDLSDLARQIAAELQTAEPERQVEFVIADRLTAEGDRELVRTVLENLLGNAWKFTSTREHARIEIAGAEHDGHTEFVVRDDGVGFDMKHAGQLFKAFQRLHRANEFPGTGIGLASVQRIISRHGGQISAHGEIGHGATFTFTLEPHGDAP